MINVHVLFYTAACHFSLKEAVRKNEIMPFATPWMDLEISILSEVSQTEKDKHHIILVIYGKGNGTPLWHSCLENPMDGGAWWAAVHEVAKSWARLSDFTFTFHFHALERKWQPTPVFLPGESQGWGSLVGCHLWGRTESDMTEET